MVGVCFMKDVYCDIINLIGLKNFLILCENFGGESIYFPKKNIVERNRLIRLDYKKCNSIKLLSKKYGISERQIRRIIQKPL